MDTDTRTVDNTCDNNIKWLFYSQGHAASAGTEKA